MSSGLYKTKLLILSVHHIIASYLQLLIVTLNSCPLLLKWSLMGPFYFCLTHNSSWSHTPPLHLFLSPFDLFLPFPTQPIIWWAVLQLPVFNYKQQSWGSISICSFLGISTLKGFCFSRKCNGRDSKLLESILWETWEDLENDIDFPPIFVPRSYFRKLPVWNKILDIWTTLPVNKLLSINSK